MPSKADFRVLAGQLVRTMSVKANIKLECGPMHNVMVALPNIGGALSSAPQSSADVHY